MTGRWDYNPLVLVVPTQTDRLLNEYLKTIIQLLTNTHRTKTFFFFICAEVCIIYGKIMTTAIIVHLILNKHAHISQFFLTLCYQGQLWSTDQLSRIRISARTCTEIQRTAGGPPSISIPEQEPFLL